MKSLKTVQAIARVLSIFVMIGFVFTVIGAVGALLGGSVLLVLPVLGEEIGRLLASEAGVESTAQLALALIAESIFLAGLAVSLAFTCRYFKNELKDGTPFTHRGAAELLRTGIIGLAVPLGALCISSAVAALSGASALIEINWNLTSGLSMILLSFVFRYGADLREGE